MAFQMVSLLGALSLLAAGSNGLVPGMGHYGPYRPFGMAMGLGQMGQTHGQFPYGRGQPGANQQQKHKANLLTCINSEVDDMQSQVRITLRPLNNQNGRLNRQGFGNFGNIGNNFGNFGNLGSGFNFFGDDGFDFDDDNDDDVDDWTIDGVMLPSQLHQKVGSYQVGVFEGGRTFGKCRMSALGHVLNTYGYNRRGMYSMSPFGSMFGGQSYAPQQPNGILSNNAVVSTGTTMYSGMVRGMSFKDLVGRSIAVCQAIQGGQCMGAIPFCCSIVRDHLEASEVYIDPTQQTYNNLGGTGVLPVTQGGVGGALLPGSGGINVPLTGAGALTGNAGVGAGSLF